MADNYNSSWTGAEIDEAVRRARLHLPANSSMDLSITITPDMFTGSAFPYTCTVGNDLNREPEKNVIADIDVSSCTTAEEIEAAEMAYSALYRVQITAESIILSAKSLPESSFTLLIKELI